MTNKQKREYLKKIVSLKIKPDVNKNILSSAENIELFKQFPERLFKYRNFDAYTEDMIINNYIYLCPAQNLDDQFECSTNFNLDEIINDDKIYIDSCIDNIIAIISDFPSEISKKEMKMLAKKCFDNQGNINLGSVNLDLSKTPYNMKQSEVEDLIKTFIALCVGGLKSEMAKKSFEEGIKNVYKAKETTGIGSLAEINNSQVMWCMYSNNYEGYCIEYDFTSDINCMINTYPVLYENKVKTNFIYIFVGLILEHFILTLSKGAIDEKNNTLNLVKLYVTKYQEWAFQKEWRVVGEAGQKFKVPAIKSIYLGKKCSLENQNKILNYAKQFNFKVFKQKDNYTNLSIDFDELYLDEDH